jgi:hypothetical protein
MSAARVRRLFFALIAIGWVGWLATPARAALLAPGCVCPAGTLPNSSTTCVRLINGIPGPPVPAVCPIQNVGHIIAAEQQQSFWGIKTILQQKQDQLQSTPRPGAASATISGYMPSSLAEDADSLSYADKAQKSNPLASPLYDAVSTPAPAPPVWGGWVQGLGDEEHDGMLSSTDTAHFNQTATVQAGLDRTQQGVLASEDAAVLGVVSSWTSTHTTFQGSATKLLLTGPGVGIYGEYVKGGFSTDLTTKFDFLSMTEDFAGSMPNETVGILNAGVSGNVQYKFSGDNNNFIEPTAGFSLTHTGFNGGAALGFEDAYTVRLQAGGRVGTTWDVGHDVSIDGSFKALIYGDAVAQGTSVSGVGTLASAITPSDTGLVRGELDPEIAFNLPKDYSVTLSGQYRFGRELSGGSAGINLRKQW